MTSRRGVQFTPLTIIVLLACNAPDLRPAPVESPAYFDLLDTVLAAARPTARRLARCMWTRRATVELTPFGAREGTLLSQIHGARAWVLGKTRGSDAEFGLELQPGNALAPALAASLRMTANDRYTGTLDAAACGRFDFAGRKDPQGQWTFEPTWTGNEAERAASVALDMASGVRAIHELFRCMRQNRLLVEIDRGADDITVLHNVAGARRWILDGAEPRAVELMTNADETVVTLTVRRPSSTSYTARFEAYGCATHELVLHNASATPAGLQPYWSDAIGEGQCEHDSDCRAGQLCSPRWQTWSGAERAWIGQIGECQPGVRCESDAGCPKGEHCDVWDRVKSPVHRTLYGARCKSKVTSRPADECTTAVAACAPLPQDW